VAAVGQAADTHDAKSHGASRQRDQVEIHTLRDTAGYAGK
jgi:hypothetical protein